MKFVLAILTTLLAVAMAAPAASASDTVTLEKRCFNRGGKCFNSYHLELFQFLQGIISANRYNLSMPPKRNGVLQWGRKIQR